MTEEEKIEIVKNLFLMPTDWKIGKGYKGKLDFIGVLEANEALDGVINIIQKQDTEINKLKDVIDRMAEDITMTNKSINEEYAVDDLFLDKEKIKEYFMNKTDIGKEGIK